jgi:hypothetical protein
MSIDVNDDLNAIVHVDPLIAQRPAVQTNPRVDGEIYAPADLWKIRARRIGVLLFMIVAVGVCAPQGREAQSAPTATPAAAQPDGNVMAAQSYLANYGYSTRPTGYYDDVTRRAVAHFQRANGIAPDGIVGPAVLRAMGLPAAASPAAPPTTVPIPSPAAGRCPNVTPYLIEFGLPVDYFDYVAYRESRCKADAYNGKGRDRSYGVLQLNTKGALWGELKRRCGLTSKNQLFDVRTNVRSAAQLYKVYGRTPWGG